MEHSSLFVNSLQDGVKLGNVGTVVILNVYSQGCITKPSQFIKT